MFGGRRQEYWPKSSPKDAVQLKGVELLDGTLFVRVAGMAQTTMGWLREGQGRAGLVSEQIECRTRCSEVRGRERLSKGAVPQFSAIM